METSAAEQEFKPEPQYTAPTPTVNDGSLYFHIVCVFIKI